MKSFFWLIVVYFFILMWIGSEHPNSPFVEVGQVGTLIYFTLFLVLVPMIGIIENSLFDIGLHQSKRTTSNVSSNKN